MAGLLGHCNRGSRTRREAPFSELDLAFQLDTLQKFFADDAVTWIREKLLGIPDVLAA
jgi:hypothetical protein